MKRIFYTTREVYLNSDRKINHGRERVEIFSEKYVQPEEQLYDQPMNFGLPERIVGRYGSTGTMMRVDEPQVLQQPQTITTQPQTLPQPQYVNQAPIRSGNIFIFHLHASINRMTLAYHFQRFGTILSARVCCDSNGYGFVLYEDPDDAQRAINVMDGFKFMGKYLKVSLAFNPHQGR